MPEVLGIDKVKVGFPVDTPSIPHPSGRATYTPSDYPMNRAIRFTVKGMRVFIWPYLTDNGWTASMTFNPARHVLNPRGWGGLPIGMLPVALEAAWHHAQNHVNPLVALPEAKVRRLDVNRDFQVSAGSRAAILSAAFRVPVPYATKRSLWATSKGAPQTIYAGTKGQGSVRAYDHHHRHHTSPRNTFRVEAQGHRDWLAKAEIECVADLGPTTVTDFFTERFNWSGLGTPTVFEHARTEKIWNLGQDPTSPITPRKVTSFLGRERLIEAGIDVPEGHTSASTRRALQRAVGIAHCDPQAPEIIRLDPAHDEPILAAY